MRKLILTSAILLVSVSAQAQVSSNRGLIPLKTTDNAAVLNTKPVEQPKADKPLSVAEQLQAIGEIKSDVPTKGQITYLPAKDEARPPVQASETKSVEVKPAEAKPLEAPKPAEVKSVETAPATPAKAVETKPVETKPVEAAKPAEAPAPAKTVAAKPVESAAKPVRAKAKRQTTQASIERRIRSELLHYGIAFSRQAIYW